MVANELVATQAGNLEAFKIEITDQFALAGPVAGSSIMSARGFYYYSPETKSMVKFDFVGDYGWEIHNELLEFAPAN